MVREVEFSNSFEMLNDDTPYSDGKDQRMFDGALSDDGKTLKITVAKSIPLETEGVRNIYLYYGNVDLERKLLDYTKIGEVLLASELAGSRVNKDYVFDISKVLNIPRKVVKGGTDNSVTIQLYTYEANIEEDYGTKRLSVPYSVESNISYEYGNNTDGLFKLLMVDFKAWSIGTTYGVGDIISHDGWLYMSTKDNNIAINPNSVNDFWTTPNEESITDFSYGGSLNPPLNSVHSDILISRAAKYTQIANALTSTGFKPHDDKDAFYLTYLLQMLRERALFLLLDHKPVDAFQTLTQITTASKQSSPSGGEGTVQVNYTL